MKIIFILFSLHFYMQKNCYCNKKKFLFKRLFLLITIAVYKHPFTFCTILVFMFSHNHILPLTSTPNRLDRTRLFASSTADALTTIRIFHRIYFHLAGFCTFSTVNTFLHIHTITVNRHPVKYRIKSSKGTDIPAKRSVNNYG